MEEFDRPEDDLNRLGFWLGGGTQTDVDANPDQVHSADVRTCEHLGRRVALVTGQLLAGRAHRARQRVVGRLRRHDVEDRVDDLVAADSEDRRAQDLVGLFIHDDLHEALCPALFHRAADPRHRRHPTSALRPDRRTSVTVCPARPSGGSMWSA